MRSIKGRCPLNREERSPATLTELYPFALLRLGPVPAECAELLFGQADGRDEVLEGLILEGRQIELPADPAHHGFVLGRSGLRVSLDVLGVGTFQSPDGLARRQ